MDTIVTILLAIIFAVWTVFVGFIKLLLGIMYYQDKQRLGEKKANGLFAKEDRKLRLAKIFLERV